MYVVSIRYPKQPGGVFNLEHYLNVHVPTGMSLFRAINGFLPKRVLLQHSSCGLDGNAESADSYATSWLCFETREQAAGFSKVFRDPDASRVLIDDMPNYAPASPTFLVGEMIEIEDLIASARRGDLRACKRHR